MQVNFITTPCTPNFQASFAKNLETELNLERLSHQNPKGILAMDMALKDIGSNDTLSVIYNYNNKGYALLNNTTGERIDFVSSAEGDIVTKMLVSVTDGNIGRKTKHLPKSSTYNYLVKAHKFINNIPLNDIDLNPKFGREFAERCKIAGEVLKHVLK